MGAGSHDHAARGGLTLGPRRADAAAAGYRVEPGDHTEHWPFLARAMLETAQVEMGEARAMRVDSGAAYRQLRLAVSTVVGDEGRPPLRNQLHLAFGHVPAPVGFSWVYEGSRGDDGSAVGRLLSVYVEKGHRKRGLGKRLVQAASEWAEARGLPCLDLSTGVENDAARALCRRLGFRMTALELSLELKPTTEVRT